MERKLITKTDILITALLAVLVAVIFAVNFIRSKNDEIIGEVYFDGKLVDTVILSEKEEKAIVTGEKNSVVIRSHEGEIFFEKSSCSDKLCVKSSPLKNAGDFSACLPERVIIKVIGQSKKTPDAIVY